MSEPGARPNALTGRHRWRDALWIAPAVALVLHCAAFGKFVVDDAAISFSYARNLALGWGLVSAPGAEPVEGFSNPLWILLLSASYVVHGFDPVWTPKLLALACAIGGYYLIHSVFGEEDAALQWAAVFGLTLTGMQTAVAAWVASGLENGLYLLAVSGLFVSCIRGLRDETARSATSAGVWAAAVSLTRADGILYWPVFPAVALAGAARATKSLGVAAGAIARYSIVSLGPIGIYLVFRRWYFGDWLPNPYYAKGGPQLSWIRDVVLLRPWALDKLNELTRSIGGDHLAVLGPLVALALVVSRIRYAEIVSLALCFASVAAVGYGLLPGDWMPEFRYATAAFQFAYLAFGVCLVGYAADRLWSARAMVAVLAVAILAAGVPSAVGRTSIFVNHAPIPLQEVFETGDRFVAFGHRAGVARPSIMHADVGGLLWAGQLRVYDLGMLCDRTIARYLGEGSGRHNASAFYDYVFEVARPTFIATRAYHSWIANLHGDPRFMRDYVAIREYPDAWIAERYGELRLSGDYVRRDAVSVSMLAWMREESRGVPYAGCEECDSAALGRPPR